MIRKPLIGLTLLGLLMTCMFCAAHLPHHALTLDINQSFRNVWSKPIWRELLLYEAGTFSSFMMFVVVILWSTRPRQFAPAWRWGQKKRTFGGGPGLIWAIPFLGPLAVYIATWYTVAAVQVTFVVSHLVFIAGLQNPSIVLDEQGIVWSGSRFRWDQVRCWQLLYHPGSLDGENGESYELIVQVEDSTFRRDDLIGWQTERLSNFFKEFIPEKEVIQTTSIAQTKI